MPREQHLWNGRQPRGNPFALPRGLLGRGAGWILARSNRSGNAEILDLLDTAEGEHVLEVGHGPGVLIELLARRPGVTVTGVDPAPEMVRMARHRNAAAVRDGRVRIVRGTAAAIGAADGAADAVVSVNNVAIWPDLEAGIAEFHRVLRPGGRAVISWHRIPARFALAPEQLQRIEDALRARFGSAERRELPSSLVFCAVR